MSPRVFVFNGWSAGPELWDRCAFTRERIFDYIEAMDGVPDRVLAEIDSFVLVGFSMGGTMALKSYLRFREKVEGMVFVSATPCMMEKRSEGWSGMSLHRSEALLLGAKMQFAGREEPIYREENLARGIEFLRHEDVRADLRSVKAAGLTEGIPVQIVQSERDGIVRPGNVAFLKEIFPQAGVGWIPGNEHNLSVVAPEAVDRAVAEVINGIR